MTPTDLLTSDGLQQVRSLRRVATCGGIFAATLSMAANVYASDGTPVGWVVGATAPAAFIFAEILSTRGLPGRRSRLSLARTVIASSVVVGAGIVSFSHLSEVVRSVGESGLAAILLPLLVDAVVLCGILTMHDTARHLRAHETAVAAQQAEATAERAAKDVPLPTKPKSRHSPAEPAAAPGVPQSASGEDVAAEIRRLAAEQPELTQAEIGELVSRSVRTVRRYLSESTPASDNDEAAGDQSADLTVVA